MTAIRLRQCFPSLAVLLLFSALASPGLGQQDPSTEELVKQTQNPAADLISVPFQNNFNVGTGSRHRTVWVLNIQPVIPSHISENWNLIARVIMPVINQLALFPGMSSATQHSTGCVRQRGKAGVRFGLAVTLPNSVPIPEIAMETVASD